MMDSPPHPVIIAGAGPCGLVVALTLHKAGIPFLIFERASVSKVLSNAGSGFDMAPSALKILEKNLGLSDGLDKAMRQYEYMYTSNMDGKHVKTFRLKELNKKLKGRGFGFASRSMLQHVLLDALGVIDKHGKIVETHNGKLQCGVTINGYENKTNADGSYDFVEVELDNGKLIKGLALLGCDGIHSRVRQCMHKDVNDAMNYCGQVCWWGKTHVRPGSKIDQELKLIEKERKMQDGNVSFMMLATKKNPCFFFSCEVKKDVHAWVLGKADKTPPQANASNDMTRRGGTILDENKKQLETDELVSNCHKIVTLFFKETPANEITRAGFFDRANLNLGYTDGLVALLGDAAHPQSPMMGQGCNMAIVDGFVAATRLTAAIKKNFRNENKNVLMNSIQQALIDFDSKERRKENNAVIRKARKYGQWSSSGNRFVTWAMQTVMKLSPPSAILGEATSGDKSNMNFLAAMERDLEDELDVQ